MNGVLSKIKQIRKVNSLIFYKLYIKFESAYLFRNKKRNMINECISLILYCYDLINYTIFNDILQIKLRLFNQLRFFDLL